MTYSFPPDIAQLVRDRMATGRYGSEDELLRNALQALSERDEDLDAIRAALAEWHSGDEGIPLDEAIEQIRQNHQIAERT